MGEMVVIRRGEIWWGETPDDKGRPYLVISRNAAIAVMQKVLVAPITSRIRNAPSDLRLGSGEGLPVDCVASFDNIRPMTKSLLIHRVGGLNDDRLEELCAVAHATLDC